MTLKNFIKCGILGWCIEIIFTGMGDLLQGNLHLTGHTSLWMFPIYGMAVFIIPVHKKIHNWPVILRGTIYGLMILSGEFLTGSLLQLIQACPWDYTGALLAFHGIIRLDYLPFWFSLGLIYEQMLAPATAPVSQPQK